MIRKKIKPNRRYTQIYADRIGFGYGSCKIEGRKSLVTFMCFFSEADWAISKDTACGWQKFLR